MTEKQTTCDQIKVIIIQTRASSIIGPSHVTLDGYGLQDW